jgi:molecular chaperone GrpE
MSDADDNAKPGPRPKPEAGAPDGGAGATDTPEVEMEAAVAGAEAGEASAEPGPEEQVAQLKDQLLRALAETENVRRRSQRDLEDVRRYAVADMARDLLTLADNLDLALTSARQAGIGAGPLVDGVELTQRQFLQVIAKHGIRPIEADGQKLDPNLHQAVMQVETADAEPGTVVGVMQVGYLIHDRLLRPAMVSVAKAPSAPPPEAG